MCPLPIDFAMQMQTQLPHGGTAGVRIREAWSTETLCQLRTHSYANFLGALKNDVAEKAKVKCSFSAQIPSLSSWPHRVVALEGTSDLTQVSALL